MALTLANGVLLDAGADAYATIATVDLYNEAVGRTNWEDVDEEKKEVLIRRASLMIAARYHWNEDALALTAVPDALEMATAELAYSWASAEPISDTAIKAVSVGAINVQFAGQSESAALGALPGVWGLIDMMLNGLGSTTVSGGHGWRNIELARA